MAGSTKVLLALLGRGILFLVCQQNFCFANKCNLRDWNDCKDDSDCTFDADDNCELKTTVSATTTLAPGVVGGHMDCTQDDSEYIDDMGR